MVPPDDRERRGPRAARRNRRPGLPDETSVVSEKTFTSPKGTIYRILTTNERDPYEPEGRKKKKRRG